jgi:antitoxin HicB
MKYPANFEATPTGGYVVTFRDVPEAITQGDGEKDALDMAEDALVCAMDFYFEDNREIPMPSAALPGERMVELQAEVAAKVRVHNRQFDE